MSNKTEFDIEIKFDVPEHRISAYTLANTSTQLIVMLEELNKYILFDSDVQIYVLPYETGSFCKKLRIYAQKHVLTPFVENASGQFGTAVIIGLGLLIYDSKYNDKNQIIINNKGGLVQIYTEEMLEELRGNKRLSTAKSNYFYALEKDVQVKKVSFHSAEADVEVPRESYAKNIIQEDIITELQETDIKDLVVVSPVLEAIKKQWSFKMDDRIRSFAMLDRDFAKRVSKGEFQFKHNDKIEAIIQIVHSLEKEEKKIKKINILKVKKFNDKILDDQFELDFETE
ncbi:MAG: hypothetical protein K8R02_04385 [Anaerohalosphaeraceae bacterium]|nr:hypothetical protein [Anaerohalosphaeraceae bacterium]